VFVLLTLQVWDIRQEGGQAMGFACDVTDRKAVMETAVLVQHQIGHVTVLINSAATCLVKPVLECTPEELCNLLDANLMCQFWVRGLCNLLDANLMCQFWVRGLCNNPDGAQPDDGRIATAP
jgi:NAD(P)-dependent dehydrogenase (short-subunit alcohol dehydrogenase family)